MVSKKKEKRNLSIKEACEVFGISKKEFLEKVKEFKIPSLPSSEYSESILEKYFSKMETKNYSSHIIAISNQKGGEGKTTISLFLSEALSFDSKVLLVDWDPQANATRLFVNEPERTVFDCLGYRNSSKVSVETVIIQINPNLHLLPSSLSLANFTTPFERDDFELLKETLLPVLSSYDFVIIDCPLSGLSESVKKYFPVFKTNIYRKESIPQAQAKRKMLSGCDKETYKAFMELASEVRSKINVKEK